MGNTNHRKNLSLIKRAFKNKSKKEIKELLSFIADEEIKNLTKKAVN